MRHGGHRIGKGVIGSHTHESAGLNLLDKFVVLVSVLFPLTAIPQIIEIWVVRDVTGVSLLTWVLFAVFTTPLIAYAVVHKVKPWAIMNSLWLVMYVIVVIGIIIFG